MIFLDKYEVFVVSTMKLNSFTRSPIVCFNHSLSYFTILSTVLTYFSPTHSFLPYPFTKCCLHCLPLFGIVRIGLLVKSQLKYFLLFEDFSLLSALFLLDYSVSCIHNTTHQSQTRALLELSASTRIFFFFILF